MYPQIATKHNKNQLPGVATSGGRQYHGEKMLKHHFSVGHQTIMQRQKHESIKELKKTMETVIIHFIIFIIKIVKIPILSIFSKLGTYDIYRNNTCEIKKNARNKKCFCARCQ